MHQGEEQEGYRGPLQPYGTGRTSQGGKRKHNFIFIEVEQILVQYKSKTEYLQSCYSVACWRVGWRTWPWRRSSSPAGWPGEAGHLAPDTWNLHLAPDTWHLHLQGVWRGPEGGAVVGPAPGERARHLQVSLGQALVSTLPQHPGRGGDRRHMDRPGGRV